MKIIGNPRNKITPEDIERTTAQTNEKYAKGNLEQRTSNPQTTQPVPGILEKDENGMPRINLELLENIAVHTPIKEFYDMLMKVYECGGWNAMDFTNADFSSGGVKFDSKGYKPTNGNLWAVFKEKTCIGLEKNLQDSTKGAFGYASLEYYNRSNYLVISTQEFYNLQGITPEILKEINNYFDNKK